MPTTLTARPLDPHLGDPLVLADLLSRPGAIEHGHFRLLSGAHSEYFLRFSVVARDEKALAGIAAALEPTVAAWCADAVLSPSTAGVSLGRELARRLGVRLHLAEVDATGRAAALIGPPPAGRSLVLVNDVVTTGDGLQALAEVAGAAGASVAGAVWFASRATVDVAGRLGVATASLVTLDLPSFPAAACASCAAGEPVVEALDLN